MKTLKEIWKKYPLNEKYEVSTLGRVKNSETQQILKPAKNPQTGYLCVNLCRKTTTIHRMVAMAFIPNPENKLLVDHINTIKTDNRLENLRWVTHSENSRNEITLKRNIESHKGIIPSEECKNKKRDMAKKIKIRCVENNTYYESIKDCGRKTGINRSHISQVCKGIRKTAGGFHWSYA